MLSWHSDISMYAAVTAGTAAFMLAGVFVGIAGYASVFVSQNHGAGNSSKIGSVVWQSLLLSLVSGLVIACLGRLLAPMFAWFGHESALAALEAEYFRLLTGGSVFSLAATSLSCFWTGRKKTWTVLAVNLLGVGAAVLFNLLFIFGWDGVDPGGMLPGFTIAGWPPLGISGAGMSAVLADLLKTVVLLCMFLSPGNRRRYATLPGLVPDVSLMRKMLGVGFGNGCQLLLSVSTMAFFYLLIGLYAAKNGAAEVAVASGIAFSLNSAVFVPLAGLGSAAAVLVAHGIGAGRVDHVLKIVSKVRYLAFLYMALASLPFTLLSGRAIAIFARNGIVAAPVAELATIYLYCALAVFIGDGCSMLYGSAIRGAGDTRYAAKISVVSGAFLLALSLAAFRLGAGPETLWGLIAFYAAARAAAYYHRYRQGQWLRLCLADRNGFPDGQALIATGGLQTGPA
mgnify:CR=1 FL=1